MELITEKVLLRHFREEDLNDTFEYSSQPGVGEMAGWKHHESIEDSLNILNKFVKDENVFAIVHKDNQKVIGHIAVHKDSENDRDDTKELGFVLNTDYQRQGIMTEVVHAILDYLASRGVKYIYACCFQENLASKRLIEKCGFVFEQEGSFYCDSLDKTFKSFDYVYSI